MQARKPGSNRIQVRQSKQLWQMSLPMGLSNPVPTSYLVLQILGPEATQLDVYEAAVKPVVEDVMKGYNATIMAYGQERSVLQRAPQGSAGLQIIGRVT